MHISRLCHRPGQKGRQNSACEEKRILIHGHFERLEAIEKKLTKDEFRSELATLIKRKEKVSKTGKNASIFDHQLMHKIISMTGGMIRGQMKRTIAMLLFLCVFTGVLFAQEYSHL